MKTLFEVAPPNAFAKEALPYQSNPLRFAQEVLESHRAWIYFLEHTAGHAERAEFNTFADRLALRRLDEVRLYDAGSKVARNSVLGGMAGLALGQIAALPQTGLPLIRCAVGLAGLYGCAYLAVLSGLLGVCLPPSHLMTLPVVNRLSLLSFGVALKGARAALLGETATGGRAKRLQLFRPSASQLRREAFPRLR